MRSAVAVLALVALACGRGDSPSVVAVGKPAPPYTATSLNGDTVSLGALRGKVVLLNIWATWCAPCREEIPYLQTLFARHEKDGFEIVGVSVDARGSATTVESFRKDFGMTYPIWLDPDERVQTLFLALGVPASYLIDRDGILRWKHLGTVKPSDTSFADALAAALGSRGTD